MQDCFVGNGLFISAYLTTGARALRLALRPVLRGSHDPAGDLSHMLSGIGELTLQEFRLNSHCFLKIGGVNQFCA